MTGDRYLVNPAYIEKRFDESKEDWERQVWVDLMEWNEEKLKEEAANDR